MAIPCEPPLCIFRLHYVDFVAWEENEDWYQSGLERLLEAIKEAAGGIVRHRSWDHLLKPWDFSAFLFEKRRNFVGRKRLFQELAKWLQAGREPALLIAGDPGAGKSALVADLVYRNPGAPLLSYHCCQADTAATLDPGIFVRSLAAVIASQLPGYAASFRLSLAFKRLELRKPRPGPRHRRAN